jgi:glycine hydroxymethyltransferase
VLAKGEDTSAIEAEVKAKAAAVCEQFPVYK